MSRKNGITKSDFYCTKCGKKGIPIARQINSQREAGHLKRLFCLFCQEETNHAEVRPFGSYNYEDFKEEFDLGRFKEGERCRICELEDCNKNECPYNKHGRCWNWNESYNCGHRNICRQLNIPLNGGKKYEDRIHGKG